jgi:hypothetical protein
VLDTVQKLGCGRNHFGTWLFERQETRTDLTEIICKIRIGLNCLNIVFNRGLTLATNYKMLNNIIWSTILIKISSVQFVEQRMLSGNGLPSCCVVQFSTCVPTFRPKMLHPSSGSKTFAYKQEAT